MYTAQTKLDPPCCDRLAGFICLLVRLWTVGAQTHESQPRDSKPIYFVWVA